MIELKTLKEQAIEHLSTISGPELDITANLNDARQLEIVLESEAHKMLGSMYVYELTERMLRLTTSYGARHRDDLVEIAKSNRFEGDSR